MAGFGHGAVAKFFQDVYNDITANERFLTLPEEELVNLS